MSHRLFLTTWVFCGGTVRHFENVVDGTTRHFWWYHETFLVVLRDCFLIYVFYFLVWFSVLGIKIAVEYVIPWRTLSFLLKKWALNLKYNDHMKIFLKCLVVQPYLVGYPLYRLGTAWPQNESTLLCTVAGWGSAWDLLRVYMYSTNKQKFNPKVWCFH